MWFNKKPQRLQSHYSQVYLMFAFSIFETIIVIESWSSNFNFESKIQLYCRYCNLSFELIFTTWNLNLFSRTWIFVLFLQGATNIFQKIHWIFKVNSFCSALCCSSLLRRLNWRFIQRSALDCYHNRFHSPIYTSGVRDNAHSRNCVLNFGSFEKLRWSVSRERNRHHLIPIPLKVMCLYIEIWMWMCDRCFLYVPLYIVL